jgi:uncharacterized protein with von Willebrand factor type A (vWA) domain
VNLDAGDGIIYFPVRHHSPASAHALVELARKVRPVAILIEGPVDFNERFHELTLDHELPIAIYAYVRLSDDSRRSAFYPFCEYSPEWQAIQVAKEIGAHAEFIDLAWDRMAEVSDDENRYSDTNFRVNPYPELLAKKLNLTGFDEVWDALFELQGHLDPQAYLERAQMFCSHLRLFGGKPSAENEAREEFMADRIQEARGMLDGPILVVTGGYHSAGLFARINEIELEVMEFESEPNRLLMLDMPEPQEDAPDAPDQQRQEEAPAPEAAEKRERPHVLEFGITLTPFTYERIDRMSGYPSGLNGPAFYDYVWQTRRAGRPLDGRPLLRAIMERLRDRGQLASTGDFIAVETTARALARLRGRDEVWRTDILDALSASIVKEPQDAEFMHPVLLEARLVFQGVKRGIVSAQASLPPLVHNARAELEGLDILPGEPRRSVKLDLESNLDLARSRALHRCRGLGLHGVRYAGGTDFIKRDDLTRLWEEWELVWLPEFEGDLIEAAVYGADLASAAAGALLEAATNTNGSVLEASSLVVDATLMHLHHLAAPLFDAIHEIVDSAPEFFDVCAGLGHLLYLAHHDDVLAGGASPELKELLRLVYTRGLWLFETLGRVKDRDNELLRAVAVLYDTFSVSFRAEDGARDEFVGIFGRVGDDESQGALTRGASHGALYAQSEIDTDKVLGILGGFADPMDLGDYLVGFFSLAREAAQRDPRLIALIDELICSASEEEFLELLPGLRLAFTFFTPFEKHRLVDELFAEKQASHSNIERADRVMGAELEAKIHQIVSAYGLRGLHLFGSEAQGESESDREPEESQESGQSDDDAEGSSPCDGNNSPGGESGAGEKGGSTGSPQTQPGQNQAGQPSASKADKTTRSTRWQLVLGAGTSGAFGELPSQWQQRERLLGWLYDREYGPGRGIRGTDRRGSLDDSQMTVPDWINGVHALFPKRTIERLEKDALDRYQIEDLVTRPEILRRAQPNLTLLKAVLRTQHLMNAEVLQAARDIIRKVVQDLIEKLSREIHAPFLGSINRRRRSYLKVAKNFDPLTTLQKNLKHFDPILKKLVIRDPVFYSRIRRQVDKWKIIILVDQSGSMLDSVIHAAVTASIFHRLNQVKTHLIAFDTQIVDLTDAVDDPVETLMKVQLGGGTDICNAVLFATTFVEDPRRTIVILISDFYEGGPPEHLLAACKALVDGGTHLLGLAALDRDANPNYDRAMAAHLVNLGAHVGAMTPGELAAWIAEKVR